MNVSVFSDLLAALDMAVFERIKPMVFRPLGTSPAWSEPLFLAAQRGPNTFRCNGTSPFLETFLSDAEQYWIHNEQGRLESEVWTENCTSGDDLYLRASAVAFGEQKFLVIERVEAEFKEKQKMLQKSLERRLDYERLIKTQEALRKSERKYHHLVDNLLEGIWLEDDKGYAVFVNPRFIELCQCSRAEEILGRHWSECIPEEEIAHVRRETAKRTAGKRATYETILKKRDGTLCPVMVSTNPLFEGERYVGSISAFTDISERRKLEEQQKHMARDLERQVEERTGELLRTQQHLAQSQKLAGIGQLAAGVSHELRNPLGIINTSVYYLNRAYQFDDPTARKHLKIIEEEVERATKIVENLLEFARRSPHDLEEIDIHELLNKTLVLLEKEFRAADVHVITDFQAVPKVTLHLDEMKQVFLNIMLNASQAMPEGGELRISTRLEQRQVDGDQYVEILFEDTGGGIPEDILADIFNPFFTTKEKGVGLGLSLVYSTMERFGGHIHVDSQVGKGTRVTLRLPPAEG